MNDIAMTSLIMVVTVSLSGLATFMLAELGEDIAKTWYHDMLTPSASEQVQRWKNELKWGLTLSGTIWAMSATSDYWYNSIGRQIAIAAVWSNERHDRDLSKAVTNALTKALPRRIEDAEAALQTAGYDRRSRTGQSMPDNIIRTVQYTRRIDGILTYHIVSIYLHEHTDGTTTAKAKVSVHSSVTMP